MTDGWVTGWEGRGWGRGLNESRTLSGTWHTGSAHGCVRLSIPICLRFSLSISLLPQSPISGSLSGPQFLCSHPSPSLSLPTPHQGPRALTERCWNNQALMMLVATLGKMPLFLFCRGSWSSSSSSPPELGEATFVSSPSPEQGEARCAVDGRGGGTRGTQNPPPRHHSTPQSSLPLWKSYLLSNFNPQTDSHLSLPPLKLLTLVTGVVTTLGGQAPTGWTRGPQMYRPAVFMVSNPCSILQNRSWKSVPRLGV